MIRPYKGRWPRLGERVFVDASAQVIGDVELGDHASVWMNAVVRGDVIGPRCLIGIGAIVLTGAEVGEESVVAAGSLVPEGMKVPPGSMVMGVPAKVRRPVTDEERQGLRRLAESYLGYKETYLEESSSSPRE